MCGRIGIQWDVRDKSGHSTKIDHASEPVGKRMQILSIIERITSAGVSVRVRGRGDHWHFPRNVMVVSPPQLLAAFQLRIAPPSAHPSTASNIASLSASSSFLRDPGSDLPRVPPLYGSNNPGGFGQVETKPEVGAESGSRNSHSCARGTCFLVVG